MEFSIGSTKVIKVSIEDSEYLEALQFEVEGYKNIIEFMISGGNKIDSDNFREYHKQYLEKNTEYELAKKSISKKYLLEFADMCNWNLDFDTNEITAVRVK